MGTNLSVNLAAPEKVGVKPKFQGSVSRGHESPHQISQSSAHDAQSSSGCGREK